MYNAVAFKTPFIKSETLEKWVIRVWSYLEKKTPEYW